MILKSLIKLLKDSGVKYDTVEHKTVYTALDSANTQRVKLDEVVKTLVLKIDNGFGLALISANRNLDKDKLKKAINAVNKKKGDKVAKKIDFAKEVWMKKNIKGSLGATPPFGELLGLPTFVDVALLKQKTFYINTGDYNYSIKIARVDFEKASQEELMKGNFSKIKKIKKQKLVKKSKAKDRINNKRKADGAKKFKRTTGKK